MSDTYQIQVECSNCDHSGPIALSKGTPATGEHECPNCGCKTATKKKSAPSVKQPEIPRPWVNPRDMPYTLETQPAIERVPHTRPTLSADCDDDVVKRSLTGVSRFGWIQHDGYMSKTTNGVEVVVP